MEYKDLSLEVRDTLEQFISAYTNDPNVIAIYLVGSYSNSIPSPNSDLDVYIIFEDLDYRERGNTWMNGFEIEYFMNPIKQVLHYLKTEPKFKPITAHMLYHGIELNNNNPSKMKDLIELVTNIIETSLDPLSDVEIELGKYSLDDLLKDIKDCHESDNQFGIQLISNDLIGRSIETFLKLKKVSINKSKTLHLQITKLDKDFFNILSTYMMDRTNLQNAVNLVNYIEKLLGGKRSSEWVLKGPLTI